MAVFQMFPIFDVNDILLGARFYKVPPWLLKSGPHEVLILFQNKNVLHSLPKLVIFSYECEYLDNFVLKQPRQIVLGWSVC